MDFFQHQDQAKKNTLYLIILFICAVIGIISVLYFLAAWAAAYGSRGAHYSLNDFWSPVLFFWVTIFTLLVVGMSSLFKTMQLKQGGGALVAQSLGGKIVKSNATDPDEQKLLNIVEEMAIATGIPTPTVYLLSQEEGINAFAAGYSPTEAVIGVTRGCIKQLNRDELQGVIAHEFSHILNGDMRLNIRLMGLLFGIMALGLLGYYTLRSSAFARGGNRQQQQGAFMVLIMGIGLMAVGFVGTFFGHLIKAAVSRQREFLADASAVQFTRNPEGVGNALRKIRDFAYGSKVVSPHAAEVSHMFFSKGTLSGMAGLFATHPPINERIRRVLSLKEPEKSSQPSAPAVKAAPAGASLMATMGQPNIEQIQLAKTLMRELPLSIKSAVRDLFGARAVIYTLLLSKDEEIRQKQLEGLSEKAYHGVNRELKRIMPDFPSVLISSRIPLIDMAMPTLNLLSKDEYRVFRENIKWLIRADHKIDIFEWVLEKVLIGHLDRRFSGVKKPPGNEKIKDHAKGALILLETLALVGNKDPKLREKALKPGLRHIGLSTTSEMPHKIQYQKLNKAIDDLSRLAPQEKKRLLEGCLAVMEFDKEITVYESELFRGFGDALDCPVPIVLPVKI